MPAYLRLYLQVSYTQYQAMLFMYMHLFNDSDPCFHFHMYLIYGRKRPKSLTEQSVYLRQGLYFLEVKVLLVLPHVVI